MFAFLEPESISCTSASTTVGIDHCHKSHVWMFVEWCYRNGGGAATNKTRSGWCKAPAVVKRSRKWGARIGSHFGMDYHAPNHR